MIADLQTKTSRPNGSMGPLGLDSLGGQVRRRGANACWNAENAMGAHVQQIKLSILERFGALGAES